MAQRRGDAGMSAVAKPQATFEVRRSELLFLIARLLSAGGPALENSARALIADLEASNLLPGGLNYLGEAVPLTYDELVQRHQHVGADHLTRILNAALETSQAVAPRPMPTVGLLAAAPFSVIPAEQAMVGAAQLRVSPTVSAVMNRPGRIPDQVSLNTARQVGLKLSRNTRPLISTYSRLQETLRIVAHNLYGLYVCAFDRTCTRLITASDDHNVKVWNLNTGYLMYTCRGHSAELNDAQVNFRNTLFCSVDMDGLPRVWRLATGEPVAVLLGHKEGVHCSQWCPSPKKRHQYLLTGGYESMFLWPEHEFPEEGSIARTNLNPVQIDIRARVVALRLATELNEVRMQTYAFSPGGTCFAAGTTAGVLLLYHWGVGDENLMAVPETTFACQAHSSALSTIIFARDGSAFITGADENCVVWNLRGDRLFSISHHDIGPPLPLRQRQQLRSITGIFTIDRRYLISSVSDGRVLVWGGQKGELIHTLTRHTASVFILDVHPQDPRVFMTAGYDGVVVVWDVDKGVPLKEYELPGIEIFEGRWAFNGESIVIGDNHGCFTWLSYRPKMDVPLQQGTTIDFTELTYDAEYWPVLINTDTPPHMAERVFCDIEGDPFNPQPHPRLCTGGPVALSAAALAQSEDYRFELYRNESHYVKSSRRTMHLLPGPSLPVPAPRRRPPKNPVRRRPPPAARPYREDDVEIAVASEHESDAEFVADNSESYTDSSLTEEPSEDSLVSRDRSRSRRPKRDRRRHRKRRRYDEDDPYGTATSRPARKPTKRRRSDADDDERATKRRRNDAGEAEPVQQPARRKNVRRPTEWAPWLLETKPNAMQFVPQMGDRVVYFRQGHQAVFDEIGANPNEDQPWVTHPGLPPVLRCEVAQIAAPVDDPPVWYVTLRVLEAEGGRVTRSGAIEQFVFAFTLRDVAEYVIPEAQYAAAMANPFRVGDEVAQWYADKHRWYQGTVAAVAPRNPAFAESPWESITVRWRGSDPLTQVSPWEICRPEDVPRTRQGEHPPKVPTWWVGIPEAQRILRGLAEVIRKRISTMFRNPVQLRDLPQYGEIVSRPSHLFMIRERLKNGYYRSVEAVISDINLIASNCEEFNQPDAPITYDAKKMTTALLAFIFDRSLDHVRLANEDNEPENEDAPVDVDGDGDIPSAVTSTADHEAGGAGVVAHRYRAGIGAPPIRHLPRRGGPAPPRAVAEEEAAEEDEEDDGAPLRLRLMQTRRRGWVAEAVPADAPPAVSTSTAQAEEEPEEEEIKEDSPPPRRPARPHVRMIRATFHRNSKSGSGSESGGDRGGEPNGAAGDDDDDDEGSAYSPAGSDNGSNASTASSSDDGIDDDELDEEDGGGGSDESYGGGGRRTTRASARGSPRKPPPASRPAARKKKSKKRDRSKVKRVIAKVEPRLPRRNGRGKRKFSELESEGGDSTRAPAAKRHRRRDPPTADRRRVADDTMTEADARAIEAALAEDAAEEEAEAQQGGRSTRHSARRSSGGDRRRR